MDTENGRERVKILFKPQTEWLPPQDFPDLSKYDEIAIDLETKDPNIKINKNATTSFLFRLLIMQSIIQYNYNSYKPR